ncbi:MAG: HlyD family efflux transporter periplasmic adaptor subunit [Burkholderiaceae bacterium]
MTRQTSFSGALARPLVSCFVLVAAGLSCSAALAQGNASGGADFAATSPRVLLVPERETTLVSPMSAQIDEIASGLGRTFRRGATLVRFDCAEPTARRAIVEAELASARANLDAKERLQALRAAGETEVSMARSAVAKSEAELNLNQVQIDQCRVRAPFTGRLVKQHVRQFQGVRVGDPLLDLVDAGPLKLRLNVPSRWLVWLNDKSTFDVRIDETGKIYPARVSALNGRVDAVSQSIEIEAAVLGEHPELLAGMSGAARFPVPK